MKKAPENRGLGVEPVIASPATQGALDYFFFFGAAFFFAGAFLVALFID
jgi:hypothetical protein